VIRLHIEPQPTADEAQAIEAAVKALIEQPGSAARTLRFNDVSNTRLNSPDDLVLFAHTWHDVARIEALEPGV
jgi:hypothetical protein